ncbi:unnamed protein product [Ostreobium quekettii]|uniref:NAD(+) kinase n=1 Tax=Ostreobium quekettii TaxID=121088 RepID=A0A8S1J9E8_9CHLO|nr:unnamed protein product [Ostreobium quekettii]
MGPEPALPMFTFVFNEIVCSLSIDTFSIVLRFSTAAWCCHSVMLIKKVGDELMNEFIQVLQYLGEEEDMQVVVEPDMYTRLAKSHPHFGFVHTYDENEVNRLGECVDFVACLGGDGVILHASHLFGEVIPPVICFHLGSLGFLTNHLFSEYRQALRNVIYGCADTSPCSIPDSFSAGVLITLRMRLLCEVMRKGQEAPVQSYEVLNEVVVDRGASPYLTNIECLERGRMITRVQADGIILATPTGSTAYSVAAGGSMVHPNVPAMLITPICPHSLTFRPVVLPDYADVELKIPEGSRSTGWVSFDGRERRELCAGDSVRVRMSRHPVPTISKEDQTGDWFHSLEKCFGWNERLQQKPLD